MWYPLDKYELDDMLNNFFNLKLIKVDFPVHGIIVPHAGYFYSGEIVGKAFSLLDSKKTIILSPNHHQYFKGVVTHSESYWQTPLGKIEVVKSEFKKLNLKTEHSIDNQIPFLQKLGVKKILPLSVGDISMDEAKKIAIDLSKYKDEFNFVLSTDLSHFYDKEKAKIIDGNTIKVIKNLDIENFKQINACGYFPLMVLFQLCLTNNWSPKLLEYKTSAEKNQDISSVVGYASFVF